MSKLPLKTVLQQAIDTGEIADIRQLLDRVRVHGLEVTRNGRDYLGLRGDEGKRFRIHFSFENHTRAPRISRCAVAEVGSEAPTPLRHIWIYALTAFSHDGSKRACYIGKTVDLPSRMQEHIMVRNGERGRGSYELFEWARAENVEVRVTVLSVMVLDWRHSRDLEGYWLKLAQQAGYETPGSDRWGKLPMPLELAGQPRAWPWERVVLGALTLEHVAEGNSAPTALFNFSETIEE
jgi:hypothetical protein